MLPPHPKPPSRAGKVQGPHPACPHGGILWDKTDCSWLKLLNSSSKRGRFCVWGGAQMALGCWHCPSPVGDMALGHGAGMWGQVWLGDTGRGWWGREEGTE